jgi:metal-responsive CopG/Arc/MetJ family transcriptional regulator
MNQKRMARKSITAKAESPTWVRASISFPPNLYVALAELAKQKKVSLAWVVREAAEKYIAGERPLSGSSKAR